MRQARHGSRACSSWRWIHLWPREAAFVSPLRLFVFGTWQLEPRSEPCKQVFLARDPLDQLQNLAAMLRTIHRESFLRSVHLDLCDAADVLFRARVCSVHSACGRIHADWPNICRRGSCSPGSCRPRWPSSCSSSVRLTSQPQRRLRPSSLGDLHVQVPAAEFQLPTRRLGCQQHALQ